MFRILGYLLGAPIASAHEVYVLDQSEIHFAMRAPAPDFIASISAHLGQFIGWGSLVVAVILTVFFLSVSAPLERLLDPFLERIKRYAPHIAQATLGLALLASGYYHAIFGVELPLQPIFGAFSPVAGYALMALGAMLAFGIYPRLAGFAATAFFAFLTLRFGVYMLNYATYLGEAATVAIFGGAHTLFANRRVSAALTRMIAPHLHDYKFLIMRICFGASLIYASLYAKLIHGELALEVVSKYHLTHYFPFDPVFLVLGAMLIEILLGSFFLLGFEVRFASLFFLVFLTMSLVFFGESVCPHIILIGTALAMFAHGYDRYSLSLKMRHKSRFEPVL